MDKSHDAHNLYLNDVINKYSSILIFCFLTSSAVLRTELKSTDRACSPAAVKYSSTDVFLLIEKKEQSLLVI